MEPHKARSARTRSRHSLESPARSARPSRVRGRQAHTRDVVLSFADEPVLTQRYLDIIDEAASASDTTGNVYRFNLTELRATNALLALAVDVRTGRVVAGAHAVRTAGGALIQGVVTARAWRRRGIAKRIVATLIRWLAESDHIERFSLAVRLYDGDRPKRCSLPALHVLRFRRVRAGDIYRHGLSERCTSGRRNRTLPSATAPGRQRGACHSPARASGRLRRRALTWAKLIGRIA